LDIVDVTGVHVVNVGGKMEKNILDANGRVLKTVDAYGQAMSQEDVF